MVIGLFAGIGLLGGSWALNRWLIHDEHPIFGNLSGSSSMVAVILYVIFGLPLRMHVNGGVPLWAMILLGIVVGGVTFWAEWHWKKKHGDPFAGLDDQSRDD